MDQNDPLASLLVEDSQALDREKVASFLKPYIGFDKEQRISFLPGFDKIKNNSEKIEILLMASKAKSLLFGSEEGITPVEIIAMDIMPPGSAKSAIKGLFDSRAIKKNSKGYFIPNYRINDLIGNYDNTKE